MTDSMCELAARARLDTVTAADLPPLSERVLAAGWIVDPDGAWLLRGLHELFAARRSQFVDRTAYEAAVNGRAIYDLDLPRHGVDRPAVLLRRGYALAREVLGAVGEMADPPPVTALIHVAMSHTDDPIWVGTSVFWADHDGDAPYFQIEDREREERLMTIRSS